MYYFRLANPNLITMIERKTREIISYIFCTDIILWVYSLAKVVGDYLKVR